MTAGPTFFTTRRRLLAGTAALAAFRAAPALAEALAPTPPQTAGPFYPLTLPLDSDNDLVSVRGRPAPAAGEVTHLVGRVLDDRGRPVPGARVEIWQCDAFGAYHHPRDRAGAEGRDPNFQGFGATVADGEGAYRFRTIRPVPYPGRTPHIHFAIKAPGDERLVTQMYIRGHPQNEGDFVLGRIRDPKARGRLLVDFVPAPEAVEPGALLAEFDIVLAADGGLSRG